MRLVVCQRVAPRANAPSRRESGTARSASSLAQNRVPTTTPLQQLFTLNSPLMLQQSKAFVARLNKESPDAASRVRRAFLLAYGRPASDGQVAASLAFIDSDAAWQQFAQALLGSNEFQFVD